jgi:altronate dehydratase
MANIVSELVSLMVKANLELPLAKGKEKKVWVLKQLADIITLDNSIESLIIAFVDIIIDVENGKLVINKQVKNNSFNCFKNCFK